jgi:ABC-type protease/lipase transport system fused ATPase/permease subunit
LVTFYLDANKHPRSHVRGSRAVQHRPQSDSADRLHLHAELVIGRWRGAIAARQAWIRLRQLLIVFPDEETRFALPAPRESLDVSTPTVTAAAMATAASMPTSAAVSAPEMGAAVAKLEPDG